MKKPKLPRKGDDMYPLVADLHERLITDVAIQYATSAVKQESIRDIAEMRHRGRQEGLGFYTKALPRLAKSLDKALGQGTPFAPCGFKLRPHSTVPKFLGWLFERVFAADGSELQNSDPVAVYYLRQILYFSYKLAVPHTSKQEEETLSNFEHVDSELPEFVSEDSVLRHARSFVSSVFGLFDPHDIIPRHGPGSVATGEKSWEKHVFSRLYEKLEAAYPFTEYNVYNLSQVEHRPEYLESLEVLKDGTAKVVLVPKDSRGPRIISCEPLEYQWIQSGLGDKIKCHLESHRLTKGHVNFRDQEVNRRFALLGSTGSGHVTLDMKEASDRVSVGLISYLFADCPTLLRCLIAARTSRTRLPNGKEVVMKKFAPMGSGLCFPIESFVFMALGVGVIVHKWLSSARGVSQRHHTDRYMRLVYRATRRLHVYGDDIIATGEDYAGLLEYFPKVGLKFNTDKCCTRGSFRESCGMDAHRGVCVTPLRLKRVWLMSRPYQSPDALLSYVALSNALYHKGYRHTASLLTDVVEKCIGKLPVIPELPRTTREALDQYSVLCWVRWDSPLCDQSHVSRKFRFNRDLWRREVKVHQAVPDSVFQESDDWSLVLRRFTTPTREDDPGWFAMTRRITLKRVWLTY